MIKKFITLVLAFLLALYLTACVDSLPATTEPSQPPVTQAPTAPPTEPPTQPPTEAPTEAPTLPPHSALYIPGLDVEDVILYFNEVVLDAEWADGGDATKVQKWTVPICYELVGDPTAEDLAVLEEFTAWLNTLENFPGIHEADDSVNVNLRIHFCQQQRLLELMGSEHTDLDGAVTFWYSDDEIYDAIICIRTDLGQHLRNSVILEELYNGLGPIQDTSLREDSIIYSAFSEPQCLTEIDELILKLLYHPDIRCGMNADECEAVIRQLYY